MATPSYARTAPRLAVRPAGRRPLISLTPLIDVVFILLVFFMLASSFLDWRAIDLDAPATPGIAASAEGAILIEVRPNGLRFAGRTVGLEDLAGRISRRLAERPDQRILVRPARGVALQDAIAVLDRMSRAGAARITLVRAPGG